MVDYLIIGGGPAGLSFANYLKKNHSGKSFFVLEAEKAAGGLCRSETVDCAPLDIGGGHFLDVRQKEVNDFLFDFMPEDEWNLFNRDSRIQIKDFVVSHPIEANIWQMDMDTQIEYLKSIASAGCNTGKPMPETFVDWIYWKLGNRIADDYMLPYNKKMFGDNLNQLGTYWLEKLPDVSFEDTLKSCLMKKAFGKQPGHAQFYYPKAYGYGELWTRMAENLGDHLRYSCRVVKIDFYSHCVYDEEGNQYSGKKIIITIPWSEFIELKGMPERLIGLIKTLKYTGIEVKYFPEDLDTPAQWIYFPDIELPYHRILVRHNFLNKSRGYWTETNLTRRDGTSEKGFWNKYAYPLNTIGKNEAMKEILSWCNTKNVFGLGRWGEHQHFNSDVVVKRAIDLGKVFEDV